MSPVGELIESHGISYHQFADDTQLLVAINVTDAGPALERLANCSTAVRLWFLRAEKSEVVIIGTAPQLRSTANIREVEVAGSRLQIAPKLLKSLDVTIDSHLRFDCHTLSSIIIIIIHEFHRDASLETKLQGRHVSRITLQL